MIISAIITSYYVLGAVFNESDSSYKTFSFDLPFPHFRQTDEQYWVEVKNYIIESTAVPSSTKIYIATQDEHLLKLKIFSGLVRISDLLSTSKSPLVYLGETKASIKGIVSPFVINPSDFYKWFYLAENINEVENYFYNRKSFGVKPPVGNWEEGFEESLFREKLSYIFENLDPTFFDSTGDLILTGEGARYAGSNTKVTLSFLDGCNLEGFWRIYLDRDLLILNIQNLGYYNLPLSQKIFEHLKVEDLAGCLVVPGAEEIEIKNNTALPLKVNLAQNSISVIPFNRENLVDIKVKFDKKSKIVKVSGGELGLVIDNRVRPLLSDKNSKQRVALIEKWLSEISSKENFEKEFKDTENQNHVDRNLQTKPVKDAQDIINKNTTTQKLLDTEKFLPKFMTKKRLNRVKKEAFKKDDSEFNNKKEVTL